MELSVFPAFFHGILIAFILPPSVARDSEAPDDKPGRRQVP
jgi:hypothetical protein